MPKELFFTIENEKQKKVLDAALKEFSEKQYHESSINQIVKIANISRGSFYQYFTDKEDLYFFIIEKVIESTSYSFMKKFIKTDPKNIFSIYRELFIFNLTMLSGERYKSFFKNMYLSMDYKFQQKLNALFNKIRDKLILNESGNIPKTFSYEKEYLMELISVLELINRDLLARKIANDLDDKSIIQLYDLRIKLFCNMKTKF